MGIRIDQFNQGYSHNINDEILDLIEDSGLLIADISHQNGNVYHEIGYLMGLNQGKGLEHKNFILIKNDSEPFRKKIELVLVAPILSKFYLKDNLDTKKAIQESSENLLPINLVSILRREIHESSVHIVDTDQNMWI